MQLISDVIAKIDFLIVSIKEQETKESLIKILRKYQMQRVKILNLQRAWNRLFNKPLDNKPAQSGYAK